MTRNFSLWRKHSESNIFSISFFDLVKNLFKPAKVISKFNHKVSHGTLIFSLEVHLDVGKISLALLYSHINSPCLCNLCIISVVEGGYYTVVQQKKLKHMGFLTRNLEVLLRQWESLLTLTRIYRSYLVSKTGPSLHFYVLIFRFPLLLGKHLQPFQAGQIM